MDSAPILLPSPQKSPFHTPYTHEIHDVSEEEDPYSYDPSPDEAVFDEDSQEDLQDSTSPHTSDDDLSTIPPDPDSRAPSTIYTPHKRRSPFRHTSSVRNIQLDTTPPHLVSPTRRAYQFSSRNGTPQSHYSTNSRPRSTRSSPSKKEKVKKEHPLVLLHLTLLPLALPYSQSLLETVLPPKKLADCKLLKEKLSARVVQERGVLIPHPKDDYDLLEERLLEALELEQGVLSRDGHFLVPEERTASRAGSQSIARTRLASEECEEQGDDEDLDEDARTEVLGGRLCDDCGKEIHTIDDDRRWDIRVYAANGLMREGAWSAAWREMERVDVEIKPYISDELKRDLEDRWEEMELLLNAEPKDQLVSQPEETILSTAEETLENLVQEDIRVKLDEDRLKEIYGEQAQAKIESLQEEQPADPARTQIPDWSPAPSEIPMLTLLSNYVQVLLQDRRNVAIFCLSTVVLLLAVQATQPRMDLSALESPAAQSATVSHTIQAVTFSSVDTSTVLSSMVPTEISEETMVAEPTFEMSVSTADIVMSTPQVSEVIETTTPVESSTKETTEVRQEEQDGYQESTEGKEEETTAD